MEGWDKDEYGYVKSFLDQIPEKSTEDLESMLSHMLRVIEIFPKSPYISQRYKFVLDLQEEIILRKKYLK